jgi:hypothetical protein
MRIPRFHGLRGRLSYANVIAMLALFFALTGGAMATTKYLQATDPITAGDLAGSTYGNPVIADGTISSAKFAPTAKAPDADKLDGINSTVFLSGYSAGTAPDADVTVPAGGVATGHARCPAGKVAIGGGYFPFGDPSSLRAVEAAFDIDDQTGAAGFEVKMANEGAVAEGFHVQVRCASTSAP